MEVTSEGVAVLTYDLPGERVNTLRADFMDAFSRIVEEVEQNPDIRGAVLRSGKRQSFIVGADIEMLSAIHSADDAVAMIQRGHQAIDRLAKSAKPFVAAVHGDALGGGFEVALACTARVLSHSRKTALGFPEVRLGLLPGLSGLQRLAAIAGLQVALDYGLTGKSMRPDQARKLGVADDVVPRSILDQVAIDLALELSRSTRRDRKSRFDMTRLALEKNPLGRSLLFRKAREQVRKTTGG
ncbi:MAG TPA: enoyl-CoA hydratase-related protein, partial [Polyangiaceae bacterium]|nr:enoyl-CoA hydratase-related protein [Polyangiaceae bacterium]